LRGNRKEEVRSVCRRERDAGERMRNSGQNNRAKDREREIVGRQSVRVRTMVQCRGRGRGRGRR
jgi:hypothetical protein